MKRSIREQDIEALLALRASKVTVRMLGVLFDCSHVAILSTLKAHMSSNTDTYTLPDINELKKNSLTVREIQRLVGLGYTERQVAKRYQIAEWDVRYVLENSAVGMGGPWRGPIRPLKPERVAGELRDPWAPQCTKKQANTPTPKHNPVIPTPTLSTHPERPAGAMSLPELRQRYRDLQYLGLVRYGLSYAKFNDRCQKYFHKRDLDPTPYRWVWTAEALLEKLEKQRQPKTTDKD